MWSTNKYALFGTVVRVPLAYFVLPSGAATFPYRSNSFLPKIYNFWSVWWNIEPQPLHLLTCLNCFISLQGWSCGSRCGGFSSRLWLNRTSSWLLNFIRFFKFVSSNEEIGEIGEIMLLLVDLVFLAPLSEILFNRTLL